MNGSVGRLFGLFLAWLLYIWRGHTSLYPAQLYKSQAKNRPNNRPTLPFISTSSVYDDIKESQHCDRQQRGHSKGSPIFRRQSKDLAPIFRKHSKDNSSIFWTTTQPLKCSTPGKTTDCGGQQRRRSVHWAASGLGAGNLAEAADRPGVRVRAIAEPAATGTISWICTVINFFIVFN